MHLRPLLAPAFCLVLVLFNPSLLPAQAPSAPFHLPAAFSADEILTTKEGAHITNKIYMADGNIRNEMGMQGMKMVTLILPSAQKMYTIMPAQKMAMSLPYDAARMKENLAKYSAVSTDFQLVGPNPVDGVACLKYQGTSKDDKAISLWVNASSHVPVKMTSDDKSFSVLWKNYQAGPQDPSLFQIPPGYHTMTMPVMPTLSGTPPPPPPNQ